MTFLPIAERELRVATRRRFTYWSRIVAAALALVVFGAIYSLDLVSRGGLGRAFSIGLVQFSVLKWMCFAFACCAGIFLTSDSVSEEKREGTIGLLFLTDLRGYDVVAGKLLSQSLRAFYGLLAAFPILALPLLVGGVTGGEFGRSVAVLANTLFLSLAMGMFVSTISRDSTKAMNGTLLLLFLLIGGLFLADLFFMDWKTGVFTPVFSTASPAWLFYSSGAYPIKNYWQYFGLQHGLGWMCLIASSLLATRTWHEKASKQTARSSWFQRWRFGGARLRLKLRRKFLEINPVLWLGLRDRWLARVAVTVALLLVAARVTGLIATYIFEDASVYWPHIVSGTISGLTSIFSLLLILWLAGAASRLLLDARRSGAMELMLVTPLDPRKIVRGHWAALCRIFVLPVLGIFLIQVISGVETALMYSKLSRGGGSSFLSDSILACVSTAFSVVTTLTGLAATAWFGMWMGLTTKKNAIAVLKNICFVTILPVIVAWFGMTMAMASLSFARFPIMFMVYVPTVVINALCLAKDIFFILWSRKRLMTRFREAVLEEKRPLFRRPPAALPPALQPIPAQSPAPMPHVE